MEDIFIQALVTRSHNEADLLDKLPEDVRSKVEVKLLEEQPYEDTPLNP